MVSNEFEMAYLKLVPCKEIMEGDVIQVLQVFQVLASIYRSAIYCELRLPDIRIDAEKKTFFIRTYGEDYEVLQRIKDDLCALTFYPCLWAVEFHERGGDCWIDDIRFPAAYK